MTRLYLNAFQKFFTLFPTPSSELEAEKHVLVGGGIGPRRGRCSRHIGECASQSRRRLHHARAARPAQNDVGSSRRDAQRRHVKGVRGDLLSGQNPTVERRVRNIAAPEEGAISPRANSESAAGSRHIVRSGGGNLRPFEHAVDVKAGGGAVPSNSQMRP